MNEQANKVLAELLQKASNGIDAAVSFSQAQIPDVIHQLLVWNASISAMWFILWISCAIASIYCFKTLPQLQHNERERINEVKNRARADYKKGEPWTRYNGDSGITSNEYDHVMKSGATANVLLSRPAFIISSITFFVFSIASTTWIKILVAPKLYLIEYAASLIK